MAAATSCPIPKSGFRLEHASLIRRNSIAAPGTDHPQMRGRRWVLVLGLMVWLCASLSAAPEEPAASSWEGVGLHLEVRMADASDVAVQQFDVGALLLVGLVVTPVATVMAFANPLMLLGVPMMLVVAPTMQARFNAQSQALVQVFATQSLASGIVEAVRSRWTVEPAAPMTTAQLRIVGYGLATRSGRRLHAETSDEPLCLVAEARLDWQREAATAQSARLQVGLAERSADAPPPLCLPLGAWSDAEGLKLRQGMRELAAVLGAMTVARLAERP
jgi:hypothetical protein